ncbi:ubiquitin-specific protease doa4, partial [Gryganskiella cystojenkinii]
IREQTQYKGARIRYAKTVNIVPAVLRDGVSAKEIERQGLFNNPSHEQDIFSTRATNDLVVFYDQNSTEVNRKDLINLFRALHNLEFEQALKRRPVLLIGGLDAWLECAGLEWVE